jgi:hypothetical protein
MNNWLKEQKEITVDCESLDTASHAILYAKLLYQLLWILIVILFSLLQNIRAICIVALSFLLVILCTVVTEQWVNWCLKNALQKIFRGTWHAFMCLYVCLVCCRRCELWLCSRLLNKSALVWTNLHLIVDVGRAETDAILKICRCNCYCPSRRLNRFIAQPLSDSAVDKWDR